MPANRTLSAVPAATAAKRKNAPREDEDDSGSDSGSDVSMINVDFDFYSFTPDVDLIALKRLLRQTLSQDDSMIDVHPLAELILSEGVRTGAGSTIKTEGEESDPWAMVAVLDINRNRANPALAPFLDYLRSTLPATSPISAVLDPSSPSRPALTFSLRLLNLPLPLIPPLYKMLGSELAEGRKEGRDIPEFTHYLVWGRGYKLEGTEEAMGLEMDGANNAGGKKKKSKAGTRQPMTPLQAGTFPYHPEEAYLDDVATTVHTYPFKSAQPRDDDSFGVEQHGRLVLLTAAAMTSAVAAMEEACRQ
ncbi:p21-C-terminal region-binding protein-domain-containing protein [Dioszegia hungarica]|uniref:Protein BCP1 n=1 Tax=Dioszegia hungarica TaxID=4972 RepID=A0AA38HD73_9TREE|nr:p21-C-terminal region-binding protein-domain-containing protein [Dioszegia hungarica]KAI9638043.1 p21-C-terminal region-binding protein-domain-containing protein [Dioszegia hungarica]